MKGGAFGANINAAYRQHPLWWLTPPPCPLGSVSLDSQTSGRISIGRRLYGQARRQRIRPCVFLCRIRTYRLPTNPVPLPPPIQGVLWVLGGGVKLSLWQQRSENHTTGLRPEENKQTSLRSRKCTPFGASAPPFPRRGNFALRSAFGPISILRRSAAKTSPSGGGAVGRRGAFPTGEARFYGFRCLWQRCRRKAAIKLIARQGDTTTLSR